MTRRRDVGSDIFDALMYTYNAHSHVSGSAQVPPMGPIPNSMGYCSFCHEVILCYAKDWEQDEFGIQNLPMCGQPSAVRGPGFSCMQVLHEIKHGKVGGLVWASFILGGYTAARLTWSDHGCPPLGPMDEG